VSGPFVVSEWMRDELGPEAAIARGIHRGLRRIMRMPDLIERIEERFPLKGAAPEQPPLPDIPLIWDRQGKPNANRWPGYIGAFLLGGISVWAAWHIGWMG